MVCSRMRYWKLHLAEFTTPMCSNSTVSPYLPYPAVVSMHLQVNLSWIIYWSIFTEHQHQTGWCLRFVIFNFKSLLPFFTTWFYHVQWQMTSGATCSCDSTAPSLHWLSLWSLFALFVSKVTELTDEDVPAFLPRKEMLSKWELLSLGPCCLSKLLKKGLQL